MDGTPPPKQKRPENADANISPYPLECQRPLTSRMPTHTPTKLPNISRVISSINNADMFKSALEKLVTPLITGLSSERDKPNILGEILDRVQCIIRSIKV
eukprot:5430571-Amphidinium_carterae.1